MRIFELWAQVSSIQPPTCSYKANTLINVDFPSLDPTIFHLAWLGFIWFCAALHEEGRKNACDFAPAVHGWSEGLTVDQNARNSPAKSPLGLVFLSVHFTRGFWHFVRTSLTHVTSNAPPSTGAVVKPQTLQSGLATQSPTLLWHHLLAVFTAAALGAEVNLSSHRRSLPSWGGCLCLRATSHVHDGVFIGSYKPFKNKRCGPTSSKQHRDVDICFYVVGVQIVRSKDVTWSISSICTMQHIKTLQTLGSIVNNVAFKGTRRPFKSKSCHKT